MLKWKVLDQHCSSAHRGKYEDVPPSHSQEIPKKWFNKKELSFVWYSYTRRKNCGVFLWESISQKLTFRIFCRPPLSQSPQLRNKHHTLCPVCHPRDKVALENKMGGKRPSALCFVSFGTLSNFSLSLLHLLFFSFSFFHCIFPPRH